MVAEPRPWASGGSGMRASAAGSGLGWRRAEAGAKPAPVAGPRCAAGPLPRGHTCSGGWVPPHVALPGDRVRGALTRRGELGFAHRRERGHRRPRGVLLGGRGRRPGDCGKGPQACGPEARARLVYCVSISSGTMIEADSCTSRPWGAVSPLDSIQLRGNSRNVASMSIAICWSDTLRTMPLTCQP